jgi:hypothetical protein
MRLAAGVGGIAMAVVMLGMAQLPLPEEEKPRMKRSQVEEMLKQDHAKSVAEARQLEKLAEELREELEKSDRHVLSVAAIKKAEEIEKLAKRIRNRMRRF